MMQCFGFLAVFGPLCFVASAAVAQGNDSESVDSRDTIELAMSQVPAKILEVAKKARAGIHLTRVRRDLEADDDYYYVFDGTRVNKFWTIIVRADGELIELSQEEQAPQSDD